MNQYTAIILLLLFSFVISESEYDNFKCNPSDTENIETGQTVTLCLHIPELKKKKKIKKTMIKKKKQKMKKIKH